MLIAAFVLSACAFLLSLSALLVVVLRPVQSVKPVPVWTGEGFEERVPVSVPVPKPSKRVERAEDVEAKRREIVEFRRAMGMPEPVFAPEGVRRTKANGPLDEDVGLLPIDEIR